MKYSIIVCAALAQAVMAQTHYSSDYLLSAPPPPQTGSTAVDKTDASIVAWASAYTNMLFGEGVSESWKTPENALGPAEGAIDSGIVSLGRHGEITLTFPRGISDGPGDDFVVFENGFSEGFLELAYVEVSSDGTNFVRFPNYSDTPGPVPAFGSSMFPQWIWGLAGRYRAGYGGPFDLNELQLAYDAVLAGQTDFSTEFISGFTNDFPKVNLQRITHLKLVDVVGDGNSFDSRGEPIYDPYATAQSVGFDLDAVGVFSEMQLSEEELPILQLVWTNGSVQINSAIDLNWFSGATLQSSTNLVTWTNTPLGAMESTTNGSWVQMQMDVEVDGLSNCFYRLDLELE